MQRDLQRRELAQPGPGRPRSSGQHLQQLPAGNLGHDHPREADRVVGVRGTRRRERARHRVAGRGHELEDRGLALQHRVLVVRREHPERERAPVLVGQPGAAEPAEPDERRHPARRRRQRRDPRRVLPAGHVLPDPRLRRRGDLVGAPRVHGHAADATSRRTRADGESAHRLWSTVSGMRRRTLLRHGQHRNRRRIVDAARAEVARMGLFRRRRVEEELLELVRTELGTIRAEIQATLGETAAVLSTRVRTEIEHRMGEPHALAAGLQSVRNTIGARDAELAQVLKRVIETCDTLSQRGRARPLRADRAHRGGRPPERRGLLRGDLRPAARDATVRVRPRSSAAPSTRRSTATSRCRAAPPRSGRRSTSTWPRPRSRPTRRSGPAPDGPRAPTGSRSAAGSATAG